MIKVRSGGPTPPRTCVECGEKIDGDIMIPEGHGPMDIECWKEWVRGQ